MPAQRCSRTGWRRWRDRAAARRWSCCRRSTSPTGRRCGWSAARRAPRPRTATRWRPPAPGWRTAPTGSTSSTSTRRSAGARTAICSPAWSASSTSRSSCPEASGMTQRSPLRWRPGAPGSTSAPQRSSSPTGWPAVIAEHGDRVAVGLDVRGTTLSARGWTQDGGELFEVLARLDAEGCARYVVTDVGRDGTMTGPNVGAARGGLRRDRSTGGRQRRGRDARRHPGAARARTARGRGRDHRQGALRRRVHAARCARRRPHWVIMVAPSRR